MDVRPNWALCLTACLNIYEYACNLKVIGDIGASKSITPNGISTRRISLSSPLPIEKEIAVIHNMGLKVRVCTDEDAPSLEPDVSGHECLRDTCLTYSSAEQ